MIKVSILVPIYNVASYIERCAISLMEQTYEDIEYIFVNDCSTDDSIKLLMEIINRYPKRVKQIKIIHHNVNRGLAASRNTALDASSGSFLFHVDSDDWIDKNCISLLISKAEETGASIIDGSFIDVYNGHAEKKMPYMLDNRNYLKLILSGSGFISNQIWGRLIKRDLYVSHNIRAIEGVNYGEDYSVLSKLLYYGKRTFITDTVYYYNHQNINSYMNNLSQKNFDSLVKAKIFIKDFYFSLPEKDFYYSEIMLGLLSVYKKGKINHLDTAYIDCVLQNMDKNIMCNLLYSCIHNNYTFMTKLLFMFISYSRKIWLR